ncbi:late competence development ComFB family protein [Algicola sagamiensis]|uniref:late competence development ComFB family protein n=1 Tax=Algicola sagamiensis TaxID=163869 RepID=UPI0003657D04|nr:late competence development ComFB family protein [Algicola sagamiensis]
MHLDIEIHNFYEHLVANQIAALGLENEKSEDYLSDLCCIALNTLPPRYIRHEVDMAFFLPQHERIEMEVQVKKAVDRAMEILESSESAR